MGDCQSKMLNFTQKKIIYRRLSINDISGVMTVLDICENTSKSSTTSEGSKLERKDVWAMCWASDNPQLLAIMEKRGCTFLRVSILRNSLLVRDIFVVLM